MLATLASQMIKSGQKTKANEKLKVGFFFQQGDKTNKRI